MDHRNTLTVVLEKTQQLLELKYSGTTPKNYLHHIERFLRAAGNVPDRVTNKDVQKYNLSIRHQSNSYRNVAINAIRAYFSLYLRRRLKGFASIRPRKEIKKPVVYDCEVLAAKINAIPNTKHKAILAIALCCWLRKSEVLNIKIEDINGSLRMLHVKQSKGCKDRVIPVTGNTLNILRSYFKEYRPKEYLFQGQNGGRYSATSVDNITKKYLYATMRFHQIRASGATFAVNNGTDIKTVSELLGHSHIKTTQHYIPVLYNTVKHAI